MTGALYFVADSYAVQPLSVLFLLLLSLVSLLATTSQMTICRRYCYCCCPCSSLAVSLWIRVRALVVTDSFTFMQPLFHEEVL